VSDVVERAVSDNVVRLRGRRADELTHDVDPCAPAGCVPALRAVTDGGYVRVGVVRLGASTVSVEVGGHPAAVTVTVQETLPDGDYASLVSAARTLLMGRTGYAAIDLDPAHAHELARLLGEAAAAHGWGDGGDTP
jgi:hypothetical protein